MPLGVTDFDSLSWPYPAGEEVWGPAATKSVAACFLFQNRAVICRAGR
jgi:hypothetical protein